jgi:hypothetical protein
LSIPFQLQLTAIQKIILFGNEKKGLAEQERTYYDRFFMIIHPTYQANDLTSGLKILEQNFKGVLQEKKNK